MAVGPRPDPLDVSLSRLGSLVPVVKDAVAAASVASLWDRVVARAIERGDAQLAAIAAAEAEHSRRALRALLDGPLS